MPKQGESDLGIFVNVWGLFRTENSLKDVNLSKANVTLLYIKIKKKWRKGVN